MASLQTFSMLEEQQQTEQEEELATAIEFDKELFLVELRKYPSIWDKKHGDYKKRNVKINAWKKLAGTFNEDGRYKCFFASFCTLHDKGITSLHVYSYNVI